MDKKVNEKNRAGYVAVIGKPNVGKSTLINTLMEQKIAAVSPKPQTTRRRQLGILTFPDAQIIFVDTPGMHVPQHKLGDYMNQEAVDSLNDADLILWLIDVSAPLNQEDKLIAERLLKFKKRPHTLMALSKKDLIPDDLLAARTKEAFELFPAEDMMAISSTQRIGVDELLKKVISAMPFSERYYDEDTITDYYERDIAAELIRESVMMFVRDEVPHCIAVRVDQYEERSDEKAYIEASIIVERDSQKGIIIGKSGEMIKKIGTRARQEIEEMSGRKVFLDLRVKVNKNWRNSPDALEMLGYSTGKEK